MSLPGNGNASAASAAIDKSLDLLRSDPAKLERFQQKVELEISRRQTSAT